MVKVPIWLGPRRVSRRWNRHRRGRRPKSSTNRRFGRSAEAIEVRVEHLVRGVVVSHGTAGLTAFEPHCPRQGAPEQSAATQSTAHDGVGGLPSVIVAEAAVYSAVMPSATRSLRRRCRRPVRICGRLSGSAGNMASRFNICDGPFTRASLAADHSGDPAWSYLVRQVITLAL